jgi:hypothetical protein
MMVKTIIRKFTDEGIEQFRRYLAELREGTTSSPPFHLLNDPVTSKQSMSIYKSKIGNLLLV